MNNIAKFRCLKNLTQQDLSDLTGFARTYIAGLEMHPETISAKAAIKCSKVFKCSPLEILAGYNFKIRPQNDNEILIEIKHLVRMVENTELKDKLIRQLQEFI